MSVGADGGTFVGHVAASGKNLASENSILASRQKKHCIMCLNNSPQYLHFVDDSVDYWAAEHVAVRHAVELRAVEHVVVQRAVGRHAGHVVASAIFRFVFVSK